MYEILFINLYYKCFFVIILALRHREVQLFENINHSSALKNNRRERSVEEGFAGFATTRFALLNSCCKTSASTSWLRASPFVRGF